MTEELVDPSGRAWVVRRRWLPRLPGETLGGRFRRRFRRGVRRTSEFDELGNVIDVPSVGDGVAGIVLSILAVIALLVFVVVVLPLLFALAEVLLLVLLGLIVFGLRVVFRRPWAVEAASDDEVLTWQVVGWKASGAQVRRARALLSDGIQPDGADVRPMRSAGGADGST